jgi:hypothetical protein
MPEQLRAREQKSEKMNPTTQINQGGAQNQEKQPPEQTGSKLREDKDPAAFSAKPMLKSTSTSMSPIDQFPKKNPMEYARPV